MYLFDDLDPVYNEDVPCLDKTRDFLIGIQEALYEDGSVEKLEHCLEELCSMFDARYLPKQPKLVNREENRAYYMHLGAQKAIMDLTRGNKNG